MIIGFIGEWSKKVFIAIFGLSIISLLISIIIEPNEVEKELIQYPWWAYLFGLILVMLGIYIGKLAYKVAFGDKKD